MARKVTQMNPEPAPVPGPFLPEAPEELALPPLPRPVDWPAAAMAPGARLKAEPPPANKHGAGRRRQSIIPRKKNCA